MFRLSQVKSESFLFYPSSMEETSPPTMKTGLFGEFINFRSKDAIPCHRGCECSIFLQPGIDVGVFNSSGLSLLPGS